MTQAEVASYMEVDRTTIRAWTEAGMPFTAPKGRGHEGSYSLSIALYWRLWMNLAKVIRFPQVAPVTALALSYFHSTVFSRPPNPHQDRNEAIRRFPRLVSAYFTEPEAVAGMHYALGYFDATSRG